MSEKGKKEIKFKLDEVANQFLFHIKETIDCVNQIYFAVKQTSINNKPLPTDSLPIYIFDNQPRLTASEQKVKSINWLFKKAFEEFTAGLTKSLIEAYCFVKLQRLSKYTFQGTERQLEEELEKIRINANKANFPALIVDVEKELQYPLYLRDEILSINRIRNCMVHRDGVVQKKDLKDAGTNELILKWISIKNYTFKSGERIALDYKTRENGIFVQDLEMEQIQNIKQFKLNDKIVIDLNEFNEVSLTCSMFVINLFWTILEKYE